MRRISVRTLMVSRSLLRAALAVAVALSWDACAAAQTPSPFPEWQDAAGISLAPLGGPIPDWRTTLGFGLVVMPLYEGSDHYRELPAPAFDIRYKDIAFASSGDGVGVNLLSGETYRVGAAVGYDLGRNSHLAGRLNGLGPVEAAPEARLFAEGALLPFVFSGDLRHAVGGTEGMIGDLAVYMPVVGTEKLVVFLGPSVTFANTRYMQAYFGVGTAQAAGSSAHFPVYDAEGGMENASFGTSAIYHFTAQWFVDTDIAWERLVAAAGNSPIVQGRDQLGVSVIIGYQFY